MTQAKVNDRKAANAFPIIANATYVFDRAYNDYGWYYEQIHLKGNHFVCRIKVNAQYVVTVNQPVQDNVLEDQIIQLSSAKGKKCPIPLRLQVLIVMIAYLLLKLVNNSLSTLHVSLQQLTRLISAGQSGLN